MKIRVYSYFDSVFIESKNTLNSCRIFFSNVGLQAKMVGNKVRCQIAFSLCEKILRIPYLDELSLTFP